MTKNNVSNTKIKFLTFTLC